MEFCETYKIIPKEELDKVFETSDSAGADMDFTFLCFEEVYMKVEEHCNKDTVIIDLGCSYMAQAYTGSSDIVVKQFIGINTPMKQLQQVDLTDMHSCKDGSFGVSDFQGFKKDGE